MGTSAYKKLAALPKQLPLQQLQPLRHQVIALQQLAVGGELVDHLRQHVGKPADMLRFVRAELTGDLAELAAAEHGLDWSEGDGQVLASADPRAHLLAQAVLLEGLHQSRQPAALPLVRVKDPGWHSQQPRCDGWQKFTSPR